jgi:anthranilate phosphoribosyltransferase
MVVHSLDGYDEVSLTGNFKIITNEDERILSPGDLALTRSYPTICQAGIQWMKRRRFLNQF